MSGDTFTVRFRPFGGMRSDDSYSSPELKGYGEIEFCVGEIRVRARLNEYFGLGPKRQFLFRPAQVIDVTQEGRMVRFGITGESELELVEFLAEDERAARTIAQRLPATMTELQARRVADAKVFEERLETAGSRSRVTPVLVAVNVAVFVGTLLVGAGILLPDPDVLTRLGSDYGPLTVGSGQWWRLLTSMFLHFGVFHLAFNMWALLEGGRFVERLYGGAAFVIIYFTAGVCGDLVSLLWHPTVNSAGASGAIFGVYGALFAFFLRRSTLVPASVMHDQRYSAIVFIAYNLYAGLRPGVDNAAHFGGVVGGFVLGLVLARPLDAQQRATSELIFDIRGLLVAAVIVGGLFLAVLSSVPGRLH